LEHFRSLLVEDKRACQRECAGVCRCFATARIGTGNGENELKNYWQLPEHIITRESLTEKIFGPLIVDKRFDLFSSTAVSHLNSVVDELNAETLAMMEGEETVYQGIDSAEDDDGLIQQEHLNNMTIIQ
jgi:hypothetical protein